MKMTNGERLWVYMRRMGLTNRDVAAYFGVGEAMVTDWLRDRPTGSLNPPPVMMLAGGPLAAHERIALARKRKGWTLREMARKLGMSHVTLIRRERGIGDVAAVERWWEGRGWPSI